MPSRSKWDLEMLVFVEGGKSEYPVNPLLQEQELKQTQPTYGVNSGNQTQPHWWEACALTTAPSLVPHSSFDITLYEKQWKDSVRKKI